MSGDSTKTEMQPVPDPVGPQTAAMMALRTSVAFAGTPSLPTSNPSDHVVVDRRNLPPGHRIDDFQVIALLGRGGFGAVYLAWQVSLGRQVALKVSPCIGQEGRTLARFDHPHIVRVYSETVQAQSRLLCMQYVASIALDDLLKRLAKNRPDWSGRDLLELIDAQHAIAAEFDPAQLADRQFLSELDHVDAVCWIGSRLADALAHAHRHDVLHRDLKPGNVLVSQYGRPMLVDFNLANVTHDKSTDSQLIGGTLPYMSPEHLEAFDPSRDSSPPVTQQSDMYSLGVVVYELLTGSLPFPLRAGEGTISQKLSLMGEDRRETERIWSQPQWSPWTEEPALEAVLRRSLDADPSRRWKSADEMSRALADVLKLRAALRKVAHCSPVGRWCAQRPFVWLAIFGLAPHFVGSLVNIPYNLLRVAGTERLAVFFQLVNVYNIVIYPICVGLCIWLVTPVFVWWRNHSRRRETDEVRLAWLRRRAIAFAYLASGVALLGWLPGAIWFPWGLNYWANPSLSWSDVFHLQISVAVSGLIALTYSALGVSCLSISVFYPQMWVDPTRFREQARSDLIPLQSLLGMIPFLAGTIPLVGAILLVTTRPKTFSDAEYDTFRILTVGLIALGMIGFQLAVAVTGITRKAVEAFVGGNE